MASLGLSLPITFDSADGFTMIKAIEDMIKQNFKMLLLTIPGERVMEPNFGVGLKTYLFAMQSENVGPQIKQKIRSQVTDYLPVVSIRDILISVSPEGTAMFIQIQYAIPDIGTNDLLQITI
jgi:phage baseplate assembly protein W